MAKVGRKTKLTPEVQEELAKIIGAGHTHKSAYEYVGIDQNTFYRGMKKGEFGDIIKRAESKAKIGFVERVKKASEDTWQAAAWMLERRWPDEFAQKMKQEIIGQNGGPIELRVTFDKKKANGSNGE